MHPNMDGFYIEVAILSILLVLAVYVGYRAYESSKTSNNKKYGSKKKI